MQLFNPRSIQAKAGEVRIAGNVATVSVDVTAVCRRADPPGCPAPGAPFSTKATIRLVSAPDLGWHLYDVGDKIREPMTLSPSEALSAIRPEAGCQKPLALQNARYVQSAEERRIISAKATNTIAMEYLCGTQMSGVVFIKTSSGWRMKK